jgi:Helix-turn-helix.
MAYRITREREVIGERVHQWRMVHNLTAQQVCERASITRDTLRKLERGDTSVKTETFLQVLRALGILDYLLEALDPFAYDVGRLRSHRLNRQRAGRRSPDRQAAAVQRLITRQSKPR